MRPTIENVYYSKSQDNTLDITLKIPIIHTRYIDKVLSSNCFEELRHLFINADSPTKEISESFAAYRHIINTIGHKALNDSTVLHIGDGSMCRTGALFTMFSRSTNYSIDPVVAVPKMQKWMLDWNIKRFSFASITFQEFSEVFWSIDKETKNKPVIITCVHAHVDLKEVIKHFPNWSIIYSNPCCYDNQHFENKIFGFQNGIETVVEKEDWGILSEKRKVFVYKNTKLNV